jgi:hypothetical protein
MIFENRTLNLIWGILFFGTLWIGFGFIIPISLILTGKVEVIIIGVMFMLFGHFLTILFLEKLEEH